MNEVGGLYLLSASTDPDTHEYVRTQALRMRL